jgi:hypothetical protein
MRPVMDRNPPFSNSIQKLDRAGCFSSRRYSLNTISVFGRIAMNPPSESLICAAPPLPVTIRSPSATTPPLAARRSLPAVFTTRTGSITVSKRPTSDARTRPE